MKRILLVLLAAMPFIAVAQAGIQYILPTDIRGRPALYAAVNIVGSPFFPADYCNAIIKVQRGKKYEDVPVKVNLQTNEIYVKFQGGIEIVASVPLEYVEFNDCNEGKKLSFRSGYPTVDKQTEATYYQVLVEGNITLLKNFNTTFRDQTLYGEASVTRTYENSPLYYAYSVEKGIVRLKDNTTVLQLLPAQKLEVDKYLSNENIKIKRETDLVKLFGFLNTIDNKK